jgi:hypothetical protein
MNETQRYDIINQLISKYNYKSYLEIGVRNPNECFNLIKCDIKHSVDPGYENSDNSVDYKYTSDSFFKLLESNYLNLSPIFKWDIIFIDGLHISDQVEKDFENSINHLNDGGIIVFHDCNPPDIWFAREDYLVDGKPKGWNGTVWKLIYKLRSTRPDLFVCTVDTDYGIGLVKKGSQKCCEFDNPFYEYRKFETNKKDYLNLISVDEYVKIFKL